MNSITWISGHDNNTRLRQYIKIMAYIKQYCMVHSQQIIIDIRLRLVVMICNK